jgi:NTE family protein
MHHLEQAHPGAVLDTRFFDGVPDGERERLMSRLDRRHYHRGAVLIAEGDHPREILIVGSGHAEAYVADRHGAERLVGHVGPGTTLGEMSIFTGHPAAATVRAASDMEILALPRGDFERAAARNPVLFRNVGAMLSARLERTNQLAANVQAGRVVMLEDHGAPPELAWAIAGSVAWHTRAPTLLVHLDEVIPERLLPLVEDAVDEPHEPRAYLEWVPVSSLDGEASLADVVSDLFGRYEYVLVLSRSRDVRLETARVIRLAGADDPRPAGDGTVVRAWLDPGGRPGPDDLGEIRIPELSAEDERALRGGVLSASTPAGRAVGWVGRDVAGLKVGLALGAGSLRGYAHIGVLKALRRIGLEPDSLAGTSVGASVAALHAMGMTPTEIATTLDRCGEVLFRPTVPLSGFLSNRALKSFLKEVGGGARIEELPIPLALVAADIETHREVVFRRGFVWFAVLASISIPGVYPALKVGPYTVVDGGVLNPVPASAAAEGGADIVVGVRLAASPESPDRDVEAAEATGKGRNSALAVILRSIEIMQSRIVTPPANAAVITIEPRLPTVGGARLKNFAAGRRFIEAGEAAVETQLPRLASAFPWLR